MASIFDNPDNSLAPSSKALTPSNGGTQTPFGASSTGGFSNPFASDGSNTENGFNTSGSGLLNLGMTPNATAQQYQIPPEIQSMLDGKGGFSPETLTGMNASAKESAANAGQQQMAQVKRQMAQNGIHGPAAAGYAGAVAKQTGAQEQANLRDVQQQNAQAQLSQQNLAAQIAAQAGEGNMQSANQLALANAQMLFDALLSNQNSRLTTQRTVAGM